MKLYAICPECGHDEFRSIVDDDGLTMYECLKCKEASYIETLSLETQEET